MQLHRRTEDGSPYYFISEGETLRGKAVTFGDAIAGILEPALQGSTLAASLVPCEPSKIICIGLNYRQHAEEMGKAIPDAPLVFSKPPSSLLADQGEIVLPLESQEVHYEAELAVVIGRRCRRVKAADAESVIFGYTLLNDVTARDLQRKDVQYTRGKGFDTFAPVGPRIVTGLDPNALTIQLRVNGELRQSSPVSDMIFSVAQIIEHVSAAMTLEPGDIIATGTPSGVGELKHGDVVEVEIAEIGVLRNTVRDEKVGAKS